MQQFIGLVKKEYWVYRQMTLTMSVLVVGAIGFGPMLLHLYKASTDIELARLYISIISGIVVCFIGLFSCIASLRLDVRKADIWLHSGASIVTLIFAKVLYHLAAVLFMSSLAYTGLFFVGDLLEASALQMAVLYGTWSYMMFGMFTLFFIISFSFYVLSKQVKKFIGKLTFLVNIAAFYLLVKLITVSPQNFLPYGEVSMSWLADHLPEVSGNALEFYIYDIYLVEEIVVTAVLALIFVGMCKWLERVITT